MKCTSVIGMLFIILSLSFTVKGQLSIRYDVHNQVFLWGCTYNDDEKGIFTTILEITNGSGNYTVSSNSEISVNQTSEGFEIFVPLETDVDDIQFTITDVQGGAVSIDDDVQNLLWYAANIAYQECLAPEKCAVADMVYANNDQIYPDTYQAINTITSSAELPDRNTTFLASDTITLHSGFSTINLTNFVAKIVEGCD